MPDGPVQPIPFGSALQITLDNYYDLLKGQVGNLQAGEFLQLSLVADTIDISPTTYPWFSQYNLVRRSDRAIEPVPVSGAVVTGVSDLASVYERFLRKLRQFVVLQVLTPEENARVATLDLEIDGLIERNGQLNKQDRAAWRIYAEDSGYSPGDQVMYQQWAVSFGHRKKIDENLSQIRTFLFEKRTILDKTYPEPADREVVDAESDFYEPFMRIHYPLFPDNIYPGGKDWTITYLAGMPAGSSGQFDDRRVVTWDKSLENIKTGGGGQMSGSFSNTTNSSSSMTSDWGASASVSYFFLSASANASEHTQIVQDFQKATTIELSTAAAYRVNINFPKWFRPTLFEHKRVHENIKAFEEFFGKKGSLLYYPTALTLLRGFSAKFTSAQAWTYDYDHRFSASGGGGFNVFGIGFGGSSSYSNETKEHKVVTSGTTLTLSDDPSTLRFVGYVLKRNTVFEDAVDNHLEAAIGPDAVTALQLKVSDT